MRVVAKSFSKKGGRCQGCGVWIHSGDPIAKLATGRFHGGPNGPGSWVCVGCMWDAEAQLELPLMDAS
jgi:hypothetical protein